MNDRAPRVLAAFAEAAAPVFEERFSANCCVNASRVAIDVLRKFKIEARPQSVLLTVVNRKWVELLEAKQGWPDGDAESAEWEKQGGYAVGLDRESRQDGQWAGHLVVTAKGCLLDPSAGQFSRPHKQMPLPNIIVAELWTGFLDGKTPLVADFGPSRAVYMIRSGDKSYLDVPGFRRSPHNLDAAREIEQRMRRLI